MIDLNLLSDKCAMNPCIIRLTTSFWRDNKGLYQRKNLTYLKKQGKGYFAIDDEASCVGAEDVICKIQNLDECEDGIYELKSINFQKDWETGAIEDWDYKLVEVKND